MNVNDLKSVPFNLNTYEICEICVCAELFSDVQQTSAMAYSVNDSDGVRFVPSFSGLQVDVNYKHLNK